MKRPIRIVLATVLIIILYVLWIGIGSTLFGWRLGGGAIPTVIFFVFASFLWRAITKKASNTNKKYRQCRQCSTMYSDGSCPKCGSSLYEEVREQTTTKNDNSV